MTQWAAALLHCTPAEEVHRFVLGGALLVSSTCPMPASPKGSASHAGHVHAHFLPDLVCAHNAYYA